MFKELWKKFGADFLQTNCPDAEPMFVQPGDRVRALPHITHTGEFHLERLTQLLKSRYGRHFSLPTDTDSSDQALKDVISYAARIQDRDVQRELLLFYLNCSPVIQEYLRAETSLGKGPLAMG